MDSQEVAVKQDVGICRCCHAEGCFRDMSEECVWMDETEIYGDMLQDCFNLRILQYPNGHGINGAARLICEDCITRLRDACTFRKEVLDNERKLAQMLGHVDQVTDGLTIQLEAELEPCKLEFDIDIEEHGVTSRHYSDSCELPDITTLKPKEINSIVKSDQKPQNDPLDAIKNDKRKHRDNLQTILKYSNAVPFKDKSLLGFLCGYCTEPFPDPADLRLHTEKEHKKERLDFKSSFDVTEYNVKLHVGDLTCTLCDEKIDNLNVLKTHLVKTHNKTIYSDIKDHILQFKLKKGDVYDCALCTSTYKTFKMLKQHMNKHYANYTCKKCDTSFATKRSLNYHQTTHQEGSHKCQHCDKVFSSKSKQHNHVKTNHLGSRSASNCPFCDIPFRSYYQRSQHLVKVHNSEAKYKCNVCNKGYILKSLLMYHIKKTHLMERNYQCTECGYKFFSKKALNAHMVKHTGERKYSCEVCHKSYARKYTLREHMRTHNNDRRFKCDVCAMTFVQKRSLKSHLLSNHGISVAASDIASTDRD